MNFECFFPLLTNSRVRGEFNNYFLQNTRTGEEFVLDNLQAKVLWNCNGEKTVLEIISIYDLTIDKFKYFYQTLVDNNLAKYHIIKKKRFSLN